MTDTERIENEPPDERSALDEALDDWGEYSDADEFEDFLDWLNEQT